MKKFLLAFTLVLVAFAVIGCQDTTTQSTDTTATTTQQVTTDNDPVILGADDVTIEKNSTFVPLQGVTATDVEDGDLTDQITYSGNVNPNAVGEYNATYTVTDSDGNVTSVTRKVTVVFTDTQAPLLSGVADETIYVGESIDVLTGISATDTVDGSVTVTSTGTVDIWTPGDYTINYSATDTAGNEATDSRVITVTFGDFVFGDLTDLGVFSADGNTLTSPVFSGGVINTALADFTYVKVVISAAGDGASGDINVSLGSYPTSSNTVSLTDSVAEYVRYFVIDQTLTDATVVINTNGLALASGYTVSVAFAEIRDMVEPTINVPDDEAAWTLNGDLGELTSYLLTNVTAVDDVDGNVTSSISLDTSALDLTEVGVYDVIYSVTDAGGNTATFTRHVTIGNLVDAGYITDPTFQNLGDGLWHEKSNDGQASIAYDANEGTMMITVTSLGNYLSAAGAYLKEDSLDLEVDQWYMFTFTVKTTIDRTMGFRMGLVTDQANGWIDDFDGRSDHQLSINGEYQTFNFYFKLDSLVSSNGSELFVIELNLGNLNYSNIGKDGVTTFKDVALYKVVTSFEAPTYETNQGADLPVKFTVGDTAPNWADYVTFKDMSNNVLTPTIDDSLVDFNTPGTYTVNYSVTDSHELTTTYALEIQVLSAENADTTGPVVSIKSGIPTTIDQYTNIGVDLTQVVDAIDAVDGTITVLPAMVDDGGLDFNVAGTYTVTYTVYDLSGNVTVFPVTVTVLDKEAPAININDTTINLGDSYDPLDGLTVVDNIDGTIDNSNVTVSGTDAFMDGGVASVAGSFDVTYTVTDAAGNTQTVVITVEVTDITWDESTRVSLGTPDEGPTHSTVSYDAIEEAYLITDIDPNTDSWDHARWVYYFTNGTDLIEGHTYKFEITVKADVATDLYFRIGSTLSADPWIDDFTGGLKTVSITDSYVTYQVIFTVDKDMPDGTAKFQFMYGYLSTDATNTIYIKQFDLVEEAQPTYEDVLTFPTPDEVANATGAVDFTENAYAITDIVVATYDWDPSRIVYYLDASLLEAGKTYRIVFDAKALVETQVNLRIGATLWVDPWIDNFTGGLKTLTITTDYQTYEMVFTVDTDMVNGNAKFQFMTGYLSTDGGNAIYLQNFKLQEVIEPHEASNILVDEFDYADQAAFEASSWTERINGSNSTTNSYILIDATEGAMVMNLPATANDGWFIARAYQALSTFGFTDSDIYLAFYVTNNTNVTTASVWLYWSGSQNAYTVNLPAIGESGWVYIDITSSGHTPTEITDFGISFNNWSSAQVTGSLVVYNLYGVADLAELDYIDVPVEETPVVLSNSLDEFTYADEATFEDAWTERINGVNSTTNTGVLLDTDYEAMVITLPATSNEGWFIARRYSDLITLGASTDDLYLAFYVKNETNVTSAYVWLYWSGNQNAYSITLPAIGETGWAVVKISDSGHTISEITDFGLAFNNWSSAQITGSLTVYSVQTTEDPMNLLQVTPNIPDVYILVDDFSTYADEAAFEASSWTERINSVNSTTNTGVLLDAENDAMVITLPATANNGYFLARAYQPLSAYSVTDSDIYLCFYVTNNTNVTTAAVWLYWSGSQNAYTITLPDIGTSGWAYVKITDSGHTPTQITDYAIGFNNWSSAQVTGSLVVSMITLNDNIPY